MPSPDPKDLTPESASPTDVAPLGRGGPKPEHEKTATEDGGNPDWAAIEADQDFKALIRAKARFIVPATVFFLVYYFALPVLVGWFPNLMNQKVFGELNWAYVFALSQFFMAWALAFVYVAVAAGWDRQAAAVLAKFNHR